MLLDINPLGQLLIEILGVILLLRRSQLQLLIGRLLFVFVQGILQSLGELEDHIDFVTRENLKHKEMCAGLVA